MKLVIAGLTAVLLWAAPAYAQDGTATPDKGTTASPPKDSKPGASSQSGVGVEAPKLDPKLIIDVFKHLTKPRPRPAPAPAPQTIEPAAPVGVAAPAPVSPAVVTPPPRPVPAAAPAAVAPPVVKPRPTPPPAAKPPPPAPIAVVEPTAPVEPVIASPAEPAAPAPATPATPVREASAAVPAPAVPAQRNASMLAQSPWLLLALLAVAAGIAAATALSRARRLGRTRAALSLDPRLDLAEGSCSAGGLALACPPMSIRTRLDFA